MGRSDRMNLDRLLFRQLFWLVRLRWVAGAITVLGALVYMLWGAGSDHEVQLLVLGGVILTYNAVLAIWMKRGARSALSPQWLAVIQITADLTCLTIMVLWTGDARSPLLGAFVFHMVFASLLLPRTLAYFAAIVSVLMLAAALALTSRWPTATADRTGLVAWSLVLLLTIYLSNHITSVLFRQRRRLLRQNHRVREMTRQLERQQAVLIQHEKMAAMGQMAAGVAHEISNPLANIDSIMQLAQRRPDRLDAARVAQIREQVDRIRRIVQSMTEFAHPTETHWQPTPINDLVTEALRLLKYGRRRQKIRIEHEPSQGRCAVNVQPHAMQQVLVNLLLNAVDAVAEVSDPRVLVRCRCDRDHCMIDVIDNGKGIPPDALDRVFEPFFTTKPVGKGTGLGLSISYSLIESQGGSIDIESEPDKGTTVSVRMTRANPGPCGVSSSSESL